MNTLPSFAASSIMGLRGENYLASVMASVTQAKRSVQVLQYILDTRVNADPSHAVGHLMRYLALAAARGVQVSVLLHNYASKSGPGPGNLAGAIFLARRGVDVRLFEPRPDEQRQVLHAKSVVIDDRLAIIGTQNWSANAFGSNAETAISIESDTVARQLAQFFEGMWQRGKEPVL